MQGLDAAEMFHLQPLIWPSLESTFPRDPCERSSSFGYGYDYLTAGALGSASLPYDDLLWRDPNAKKIAFDNGSSHWGDPEISNARPIRYWLVSEGEGGRTEGASAETFDPESDGKNTKKFDGECCSSPMNFTLPETITKGAATGWKEVNSRDVLGGVDPFFRGCSDKVGMSCSSVPLTALSTSDNVNECDGAFLLQNKPHFSDSSFVGQLRSILEDLRLIAMDLQCLISQMEDGNTRKDQIESHVHLSVEVMLELSLTEYITIDR
nr:unnamed protein product [Haemonchus contortus]